MDCSGNTNLSARFSNMSVVCALVVVMIHVLKRPHLSEGLVHCFSNLVGDGVCRIAVPYSFFAAGYFLSRHLEEDGYWMHEVKKRCKSLVIPFVSWAFISAVVCSLIMIATHNEGIFRFGRLLRVFGLHPFAVPELRQTWFLRVLFIFVLLSPVFKRFATWIGILFLFVLYLVTNPFGPHFLSGNLCWLLNFGLFSTEGAVYFSLGILLFRNKTKLPPFRPVWGLIITFCGMFLMSLLCLIPNISTVPQKLAIPIMMIGIFMMMPVHPIAWIFQEDSFKIYLIHLIVIFIYFAILDSHILGDAVHYFDPGRCLVGVGFCFLCVVALTLCAIVLLKWACDKSAVLKTLLWGGR